MSMNYKNNLIYLFFHNCGLDYVGAPVGTVVGSALSGFLCEHGYAGGWPSIFYTFGRPLYYIILCLYSIMNIINLCINWFNLFLFIYRNYSHVSKSLT